MYLDELEHDLKKLLRNLDLEELSAKQNEAELAYDNSISVIKTISDPKLRNLVRDDAIAIYTRSLEELMQDAKREPEDRIREREEKKQEDVHSESKAVVRGLLKEFESKVEELERVASKQTLTGKSMEELREDVDLYSAHLKTMEKGKAKSGDPLALLNKWGTELDERIAFVEHLIREESREMEAQKQTAIDHFGRFGEEFGKSLSSENVPLRMQKQYQYATKHILSSLWAESKDRATQEKAIDNVREAIKQLGGDFVQIQMRRQSGRSSPVAEAEFGAPAERLASNPANEALETLVPINMNYELSNSVRGLAGKAMAKIDGLDKKSEDHAVLVDSIMQKFWEDKFELEEFLEENLQRASNTDSEAIGSLKATFNKDLEKLVRDHWNNKQTFRDQFTALEGRFKQANLNAERSVTIPRENLTSNTTFSPSPLKTPRPLPTLPLSQTSSRKQEPFLPNPLSFARTPSNSRRSSIESIRTDFSASTVDSSAPSVTSTRATSVASGKSSFSQLPMGPRIQPFVNRAPQQEPRQSRHSDTVSENHSVAEAKAWIGQMETFCKVLDMSPENLYGPDYRQMVNMVNSPNPDQKKLNDACERMESKRMWDVPSMLDEASQDALDREAANSKQKFGEKIRQVQAAVRGNSGVASDVNAVLEEFEQKVSSASLERPRDRMMIESDAVRTAEVKLASKLNGLRLTEGKTLSMPAPNYQFPSVKQVNAQRVNIQNVNAWQAHAQQGNVQHFNTPPAAKPEVTNLSGMKFADALESFKNISEAHKTFLSDSSQPIKLSELEQYRMLNMLDESKGSAKLKRATPNDSFSGEVVAGDNQSDHCVIKVNKGFGIGDMRIKPPTYYIVPRDHVKFAIAGDSVSVTSKGVTLKEPGGVISKSSKFTRDVNGTKTKDESAGKKLKGGRGG